MSSQPYNPLEKAHLAESVARVLLNQPISPLPPAQRFEGAGIYAIYYCGDFGAYAAISEANAGDAWRLPIYVGRAQPPGARKGLVGLDADPGTALYDRLRQHGRSIEAADNLRIEDFGLRYLVVEDIWIALGESLLINWFEPVWNVVVDGFGNHDPGRGRHSGACPLWDTLHPGREWAERLVPSNLKPDDIVERVDRHLDRELRGDNFEDDSLIDLMAAEDS